MPQAVNAIKKGGGFITQKIPPLEKWGFFSTTMGPLSERLMAAADKFVLTPLRVRGPFTKEAKQIMLQGERMTNKFKKLFESIDSFLVSKDISDIISEVRDKNLFFRTDVDECIDKADMVFMAVNTPTKTEGEGKGMAADLKYVESCARAIAKASRTDKIT